MNDEAKEEAFKIMFYILEYATLILKSAYKNRCKQKQEDSTNLPPSLDTELEKAAEHLQSMINLPSGAVTVLPIPLKDDERIIVWVDSRYLSQVQDLPSLFEGYKVSIEVRSEIDPY
jgi:uncharacterized protein (DUF1499 family)